MHQPVRDLPITGLRLEIAEAEHEPFLRNLRGSPLAAALVAAGVAPDHVEAVADLQHRARQADYGARYPDALDRVALVDGRPVGRVWTTDDDAGGLLVLDIAVAPEVQRAGIGRMLVATVCAEADQAGLATRATVERTNAASLALFTRAGFTVVDQDPLHVMLEHPA